MRASEGWIEIAVRDRNDGAMGLVLGLGIANGIIEGHGGELVLANHAEGGLNAVIRLPA
jgi:K+-sensing histidine kinase KdpD